MQKKTTWIVSANQAEARIFERFDASNKLVAITSLSDPAGRSHARDLGTDKPGRSFDSAGGGRHSMEDPTPIKKQEANRFAKEIAQYLQNRRSSNSFDNLVLICGPEFLGLLQSHLDGPTEKLVTQTIKKNLHDADEGQIISLLNHG